jgi:hypothetical protein
MAVRWRWIPLDAVPLRAERNRLRDPSRLAVGEDLAIVIHGSELMLGGRAPRRHLGLVDLLLD